MTGPVPPSARDATEATPASPDRSPDFRARIEAYFEEALDVPEDQRDSWLAARCGSDHALRREVEALLEAHARADGILGAAGDENPAAALRAKAERGRQIGPYRVLRELGRGGMGVVYLAERNDGQFRRRVAVKLLHASADAEELHQRFLTERQILASLSHPNIALLLDGGVADGQLPYLVIEYVDGVPITEYCDRQRLGIDARLRLFQEVCGAVHHAHQNLVLHRDLKPGNVLVTTSEHVKLLDFGIAKILNPTLTAAEQPVTRTAFRLMTPAYASPEQVRGDSLTTASDVYALGLVLYELLTGHQAHRFGSDAPRAVFEAICEREPERPSVRVTRTERADRGDGGPGERTPAVVAGERDSTPDRLRRRLQGDLDAIAMMALRKEPTRRYGSAELLAADIARQLEGLPVLAHRGSRWYRARKFLTRHRGAATATGIGALALVLGASGAIWQAGIAGRERDRATAALIQSQNSLRQSEEVTGFLVGLFEASDPLEGRLDRLSAPDLLRRGIARLERLSSEPLVQAQLLDALGRVYVSLGDLTQGTDLLGRALAIRRAQLGTGHAETATSASRLAALLTRRGEYVVADSLARDALQVRQSVLPDGHPDIAASLRQLSSLAVYRGDLSKAEDYVRGALAVRRRGASEDDSLAVRDLESLASVLWRRGDMANSERTLREAVALALRTRPRPQRANSEIMLRLSERLQDRRETLAEAEQWARDALEEARSAMGEEHPQTALAMMQLGSVVWRRGQSVEGERLLRAGLAIQRRVYGPTHSPVASALDVLSLALVRAGRTQEAEQASRDAMAIWEMEYGNKHSVYAEALRNLGDLVALRGALDSAEALERRAVAIRAAAIGPDHTVTALTSVNLANVVARQGRYAEADSIYQWALTLMGRQISNEHPDMRRTYAGLASLYQAWGKPEQAERYRRLAEPTPP